MGIVPEGDRGSRFATTAQFPTCPVCGRLAESLIPQRDRPDVCGTCVALFWFAEVLLEADVTEAEIVPTLAFAPTARGLWDVLAGERRAREARVLVGRYPAFDLVGVEGGVPILRMKPATAEAVRYEGSSLVRGVRLRVLSRFARPDATAQLYRAVCEREGLPVHKTSPGAIS